MGWVLVALLHFRPSLLHKTSPDAVGALSLPQGPLLHLKPLSAGAANNSVVKKEFSVLKMLVFHIKDEGFLNLASPQGLHVVLRVKFYSLVWKLYEFLSKDNNSCLSLDNGKTIDFNKKKTYNSDTHTHKCKNL